MSEKLVTLVLSAGQSLRMGSPKALLPWGKSTVLEHIISRVNRPVTSSGNSFPVLIITGAHHKQIGSSLPGLANQLHYNPNWKNGMGNSLTFGIERIKALYRDASAVLILLVDQPMIGSDYIDILRQYARKSSEKIIASSYPEGCGVPAIIPATYWNKILLESPKRGAKSWLRQQKEVLVPQVADLHSPASLPDLRDMDTPSAYQTLYNQWLKEN